MCERAHFLPTKKQNESTLKEPLYIQPKENLENLAYILLYFMGNSKDPNSNNK